MIIPGKKSPDGTFVPYVEIVNAYQAEPKIKSSNTVNLTLKFTIALMISPSVFQNKVERVL